MATQQWQLALAMTLGLTNLTTFPPLERTQSISLVSQKPPDPPSTPPPSGNRKPGGGLGESEVSCPSTNKPLTALMPVNSQGQTISEHPTFWFYIPYDPEDISTAEFSLLTQDEKTRIYRVSFQLPATPGIIGIRLPSSLPSPLEAGKFYHWYLKLNCTADTSSQSEPIVDGWVQRVTINPNSANSTIPPDIWYDTLTDLANRRLADPENEILKNDWANLLKSVGLEELSSESLVGIVSLSEP